MPYWRNELPAPGANEPAATKECLRRHGRVRTAGAVICSLGEVVDISASGMRVRCSGRPEARVGRRINITIAGDGDPFLVAMRPVWIRKVGFFKYELGGCFEDVDESTRMQLLLIARSSVTVLPEHG